MGPLLTVRPILPPRDDGGSHVADLSVSAEHCAERGPRDDR